MPNKYFHKNHYDAVRDRLSVWPHLYLYSRADPVHRDVELFVDALKQKGARADSFLHARTLCD